MRIGGGYMENEETMKPDYVYEEKGGKYLESVENDNRWDYIENEKSVKLDNVYDDEGGKNAESVEDENENGLGYMENVGVEATRVLKRDLISTKKTQKGQGRLNGEKEFSYCMRTGTCKYGISCRFHHPEPTTVGGADSPSGYGNDGSIPSQLFSSSSISSWSSPRAFNETSPFTPSRESNSSLTISPVFEPSKTNNSENSTTEPDSRTVLQISRPEQEGNVQRCEAEAVGQMGGGDKAVVEQGQGVAGHLRHGGR
ncbi:zinc finger CCCH domain-containing protein 43 [Phtheirospermum japonicum]|uniref:Zinc finger CCCH domain-containing protein 43 n=1 Tax=Phtheirospermum japonicum TaxID=374723 RepID=A0A830CB02_9LAMI|nr:zinc finger CCCH domain-containing protein 43 [Phtheirospermum japonicum]